MNRRSFARTAAASIVLGKAYSLAAAAQEKPLEPVKLEDIINVGLRTRDTAEVEALLTRWANETYWRKLLNVLPFEEYIAVFNARKMGYVRFGDKRTYCATATYTPEDTQQFCGTLKSIVADLVSATSLQRCGVKLVVFEPLVAVFKRSGLDYTFGFEATGVYESTRERMRVEWES